MATRKQLTQRLEAIGATLDEDLGRMNFDAPRGTVWNATGTHTLAYYRRGWDMPALYDAMLADLKGGTDPCDTSDCDVCGDE